MLKLICHILINVLVTCDEGNVGSKTIERNGRILENIIDVPGGQRKDEVLDTAMNDQMF